jgi:hypothetical protein
MDGEASADAEQPKPADAQAGKRRLTRKKAPAIVANFDCDSVRFTRHSNSYSRGARMFDNIEKKLAHTLKEHPLKFLVQDGQRFDVQHVTKTVAFLQFLSQRLQGSFEAALQKPLRAQFTNSYSGTMNEPIEKIGQSLDLRTKRCR